MAIITGNEFDNFLRGTAKSDSINGQMGRDTIHGYSGSDLIDGGEGDDFICGGNGDDTLTGGIGDDSIRGGNGNDTIMGYGLELPFMDPSMDKDYIDGGKGDDTIVGSNGQDTIIGGDGDDRIAGDRPTAAMGGSADMLHGGRGDDFISPYMGADFIDGGSGNDIIDLLAPRRGAPPNNPDGEDTVQFSFMGSNGNGLGHDEVRYMLDEDRLLFNDLAKNNRIDTLDELLSVTTFHDTGENTYQLDWDGGKASVSLEVVPGMFVQPPDIYDNFTTLQQFSAVFHIDFT
jgi:Ca2+-binding RTX toxin-like protein